MNRTQAAERIRKLQALADPERGGSPAERKLAADKAAKLAKTYGITDKPPPRPRYRPPPRYQSPPTPRRSWTSVIYTTEPMVQANWSFNVKTGEASSNVKVHHHRNRHNWKIEIPVDAIIGED